MLFDHSEWVRTCEDCKIYVHGPNGEISETPGDDGHGNLIMVPMLMADFKAKPNCAACPKLYGIGKKEPLPDDLDFNGWFLSVLEAYREGKACGFGPVDPLMKSCFGIIAEAVERRDASAVTSNMLSAIAFAFKKRGV